MKILIIDDKEPITKLVAFDLENNGYSVFTSNSGISGLHKMRREKIDLIVLDIEMPDLSGLDILRIMKTDAKLKNIKVIVLSGVIHYKEAAAALGCDDFIAKPFTSVQLIEKIKINLKNGL
ncbi:response regulator [Candidatus Dependentiae bacterium]|nr:response regulator [Candidatus Dependentiae bacterium]